MIIYEVNIEIDMAVFEEYIGWLKPHIKELLAIDGFIKADLLFENDDKTEGIKKITVAYYLKDYDAYHNYVETHANKMRKDAIRRFEGQFKVARRILELKDSFISGLVS